MFFPRVGKKAPGLTYYTVMAAKLVAVKFISFNVGLAYWNHNKNTVFPSDLVREIDGALARVDTDNTEHVYRSMLDDIRNK